MLSQSEGALRGAEFGLRLQHQYLKFCQNNPQAPLAIFFFSGDLTKVVQKNSETAESSWGEKRPVSVPLAWIAAISKAKNQPSSMLSLFVNR